MKRILFAATTAARQLAARVAVGSTIMLAITAQLHAATIAGWDFNSLPGGVNNFGPATYSATTVDANVTVGGLTRGGGVGTTGTGAGRAWGGTAWDGNADAAAAIAAGDFVTFTLQANAGRTLSLSSIDPFQYRRSGTGPASGLLQFSTGGSFTNITALDYSSSVSTGGSLAAVDLSGIAALQNVAPTTLVTFRIANFGATGSSGTWYLFDVGTDAGVDDFVVNGSTNAISVPEPATAAIALLGAALVIGSATRRHGRVCGR